MKDTANKTRELNQSNKMTKLLLKKSKNSISSAFGNELHIK